ncbi:hypothetical protein GCM10009841_11110 [Microlunatus panaciterrae]|uniref:DUF3017 domain-containing protein n=1 Tax=Microlunatus panaciterrae TaxID=400768 RepID=A0ABS2RLX3_9ACTN|nr:DUF3017 domain-containing protein [Microlunatus panaciterrae]MBM7799668.1 hypothetical protein [Microlunatus panaciterrae]
MVRDDSASSRAAARSLKQWPLMIVVGGIVIGLVVIFLGQWRFGCLVIGSSLGVGAVERIALSNKEAGLLQVRSRPFDILVMIAMGAGIIALTILVPEGGTGR